jgi:predicted phosphodiesterase
LQLSAHLESTHDCAVLLGDVLHADWGTRVGPRVEEVGTVVARYPRLWKRWSEPFFVLVAGNHDRATRDALGARDSFTVNADGMSVFYTHGDAYDVTLHGIIPDLTMWIVGRLRARGWRRLSDWIEDVFLQRMNDLFNRGDPIMRAAERLASSEGHQVIVAGHTHVPMCVRLPNVVYANSGATVPGALTFISVDTEARRVEMRRYDEHVGRSVALTEARI